MNTFTISENTSFTMLMPETLTNPFTMNLKVMLPDGRLVPVNIFDVIYVEFGNLTILHTWPSKGMTAGAFKASWLRSHPDAKESDRFQLLFYRIAV